MSFSQRGSVADNNIHVCLCIQTISTLRKKKAVDEY